MTEPTSVITEIDRRRLGTMIQEFHANSLERREYLDRLEAALERARALEPSGIPDDAITMNSTVRLRDLDSNEIETYTLVYPDLADMSDSHISVLAPTGAAMLGCRVGDVIERQEAGGSRHLKVEKVLFQPERAGRYDL